MADLNEQLKRASGLHARGELNGARTVCREILAIQPRHGDALHLLGLIAAQSRDLPLAVQLIGEALEIDPNNAACYCNRGTVLQELEQWEAALGDYDRAVALKADYAVAYNNRGNVLDRLERWEGALASFERAISLQPAFAVAWSNRGQVLRKLERWDEALASYDRAIGLKPDFAEAFSNRGILLKALNRLPEALASYDRAIALRPDYADAYANRGDVLRDLNDLGAALASVDRALALNPQSPDAHFNKALVLLTGGHWRQGWSEYEWRWRVRSGLSARRREFAEPLWLGQGSVDRKTLLIHCEQGLGDTLQFCRYVKPLADLGARVILQVQAPLVNLLGTVPGVLQVLPEGAPLPSFDYHCPLLSLPLAFNTTPQTIPPPARLKVDAARVAQWRLRVGGASRPAVGLVWSGNARHGNDGYRSIPLAEWIAHLPAGFQYVALQKEARAGDRKMLAAHPAIVDVADELHDFSDTAALCECLDLVICADTSVAHLSGTLGKRTWVLLPRNADWRWQLNTENSPWYPSATLYRQTRLGEWADVLRQVGADLATEFGRSAGAA